MTMERKKVGNRMPVVTVQMAKGRSVEQKRVLARAITDLLVTQLGVNSEWVTVLFDEFERDNWATNGELHSDKRRDAP